MEPQLHRLAAAQLGLLHRRQIADLGLTGDQLRRRVARGDLRWKARSVLAVPGAPATREQTRLLALLDAGDDAALAHRTAASVWGIDQRSGGLHVVRPRRGFVRSSHLAQVHEVRDLWPEHVVHLGPLRVTTPARTIMDLAAREPLGQVARALDRMWGRRLLTIGGLWLVLRQVRVQGRRGVRFIEMLVEERRGMVPPESGLERRFEQILRDGGIRMPRRQVEVFDHEGWIGRVDFFDDDLGLVIFIDGSVVHTALTDVRNDDAVDARLRAAGYLVERFSDLQVLYQPDIIVRTMRARHRAT